MKIDDKTGLVLEGGGMRGVFTCGVLDYMMDKKVWFPYGVGVSAGACNGLSYMSRQRGRAKFSNIDLLEKYHYIGIKHLWRKHSILDQELLYEHFPKEILPYVCPIAYVDGEPMLDGGIVDSIPVLRAIEQGFDKNVVVLTRNRGYRKKGKDMKIPHFIYKKYPRLRVVLSKRCRIYNEQLDLVEQLEDKGRIVVIRPEKPMEVDRIETDIKKLTDLYEEGYACAKKMFEEKRILQK